LGFDGALSWCTQIGGDRSTEGAALAVDGAGDIYLAGTTDVTAFDAGSRYNLLGAIVNNAPGLPANNDVFVMKFHPQGGAPVWTRILGGPGDDHLGVGAIATDGVGGVYVVGTTSSATGLATTGAYLGGVADGFVSKLSSDGPTLWCRYLGGEAWDEATAVVADATGAYVTGWTSSGSFPLTKNAFSTTLQNVDPFLAKIGPDGATLTSSYLGVPLSDKGSRSP